MTAKTDPSPETDLAARLLALRPAARAALARELVRTLPEGGCGDAVAFAVAEAQEAIAMAAAHVEFLGAAITHHLRQR
ncbi:MAG: hypothetical protein ACOY5Y_07130 [Pseudomonadota bacterium]